MPALNVHFGKNLFRMNLLLILKFFKKKKNKYGRRRNRKKRTKGRMGENPII